MDFSQTHLLAAKILCMLLLASTAACGVKVDGDSEDGKKAQDQSDPPKNQLFLTTDGGYSLDFHTSDATCKRQVNDQVLTVTYHQDDGPDAGLGIKLTATGALNTGDAIGDTPAPDRFFDFQLMTPAGASYHYLSSYPTAGSIAPAPTGVLTVISESDYSVSGRLVVNNLTAAGAPPGTALTAQGSFSCQGWED